MLLSLQTAVANPERDAHARQAELAQDWSLFERMKPGVLRAIGFLDGLRERARALISISHPDFRKELEREAKSLYWP